MLLFVVAMKIIGEVEYSFIGGSEMIQSLDPSIKKGMIKIKKLKNLYF
jgi:hypothetical protein